MRSWLAQHRVALGTKMRSPLAPARGGGRRGRCAALLLIGLLCCAANAAFGAPAFSRYGVPKYGPDFTHFDYVNADAPKGGTLVLGNEGRLTSFDKFNPFTLRGNAAPGLGLLFDTLLASSADERDSAYALLADDVEVGADGLSVTFHIDARARFADGTPVRASDVKFSFDTLMSTAAAPGYRISWRDVKRAVVQGDSVRFEFARTNPELPLLLGGLPVFSPAWLRQPDGSSKAFDALGLEFPIASGPYRIERYSGGSTVTYRRRADYWAADLPTRRGMFNFDHVVYKLYGDLTAQLEAFKAGEFDAIVENRARNWARAYVGRRFNDGELLKRSFVHHNGTGMQGFFMNLRRPLFQDARVRQALDLALDFEWMNRQLFFGAYHRIDSYYVNSDLAATGTPQKQELALLEPWRKQLPPEVFGPMVRQPSTSPPGSLRENLRRARDLLAQAGWHYRDGALRNEKGEPFTFELLDDAGSGFGIVTTAYLRNLEKLGIQARFRTTDFALYVKRLETFDFDMTTLRLPDVQSPGNELVERFGSISAHTEGSDNVGGLAQPVIDALIADVLRAQTRAQLQAAVHALDRVLMHGYYVIPHWYSNQHRIAYRATLGVPEHLPLYYSAGDWIVGQWWDRGAKAPQ